MSKTVTLFKPSRQEAKAKGTDNAARAIIESEAKARRAKTDRLREARLASVASAPPIEKKAPRKAAAKVARKGLA